MPVLELLLNPFAGPAGVNLASIGFYSLIAVLMVCGVMEE